MRPVGDPDGFSMLTNPLPLDKAPMLAPALFLAGCTLGVHP